MLLLLLGLALSAPGAAAVGDLYPQRSTAPIIAVWPPEGLVMPGGAEGEFILGSVIDPKAPFQINGQPVVPHGNGAFLAWLPVQPGTFTFRMSLSLPEGTTEALRTITVGSPPVSPLPAKPLAIDAASLQPRADTDLAPGDWLVVRMRASPGQEARWRLGERKPEPMREVSSGVYEAQYMVRPADELAPATIRYELGKGWGSLKTEGTAKVSFSAVPRAAVVRSSTPIRTGAANGYWLFPLPGTRVLVTGRQGPDARLRLAEGREGWIALSSLELQPGAPLPRAVTGNIGASATPDGAVLRIGLSEKIPFEVRAADDLMSLTVRLYSATGHTNWITYDDAADFVESVRWRQEATGVVDVDVRLSRPLWGWNPSFDGSSLRLELRQPPRMESASEPLRGLKIMLDPGHMPSATGSTGPRGTREMDANYAIAKAIESLLVDEGAVTLLTRSTTDHEVSLVDRPRQAVDRRADLFVSLHNNALPDGENPFSRPRGFSVFYYHPHSLALGKALYESYVKSIPLPAEQLRYGDLLVARLSAVPAVLVENAYMIVPSQEEKLNDPAFRRSLAKAVVEGLKRFSRERLQKPAPKPKGGRIRRGE